MIDFNNGTFVKLRPVNDSTYASIINPVLIPGEEIISTYQSVRDGVVFTNKRLIVINVQGLTGKKKDLTSLPYSKIQAYSVETAGHFDLDSELEIWFSGLGKIKLEFTASTNISHICKMISGRVL